VLNLSADFVLLAVFACVAAPHTINLGHNARISTLQPFLLGAIVLFGVREAMLLAALSMTYFWIVARPRLPVHKGLFNLCNFVLAAWLGDGIISLGSIVGFLTVLGIVARNGIMMICHFQHLERVEGEPFGMGLVIRGARERISPILMTASATGLALVPLLVAGTIPGHEIEHPMAVVILGGLFTSTLMNLFIMPSLYLRFARPMAQPAPVQNA